MTQYQGNVQSYVLDIQSPNNPYNHRSVISLHGAFGLAMLYFVPQNGQLGVSQKRMGQDIFDIYCWIESLAPLHRPAAQREAGALPVRRFEQHGSNQKRSRHRSWWIISLRRQVHQSPPPFAAKAQKKYITSHAGDVRYWHLADIGLCAAHVRFRG